MADKRRTALDWEDIRYFVALARLGTLSATARALRVNHATVARHMLLARHIGTIALGLYASRAYRDKHAARAPVLIGYDEDSDFIPEASWLNQTFAGRRFAFRITNQSAQAAAARAGFGIALLPRFIAANDPELVPMALKVRLPERPVWLMLRRDLRNVPRVRAVADYLVELFRRERKLLSG